MKTRFRAVAALVAVCGLLGCGERERPRVTALFINDIGYSKEDIRDLTAEFQKKAITYDVLPFFVPYQAQRERCLTPAATQAQAYDVVVVDGIWTAEFVQGKFLVDLTDQVPDQSDLLGFARESFQAGGKLYALPWAVDCECLFYNRSMVKAAGFSAGPPRTWPEMEKQARTMKEKGIVTHPIVAHWGHDEALVCDFASLLLGRGGSFLSGKDLLPAFTDRAGVETVERMKKWLDQGLVNPASLECGSDDARHIIAQGQAAFNVNWLSMYEDMNDPAQCKVAGQIGVALMPAEGGRKGSEFRVQGSGTTRTATAGHERAVHASVCRVFGFGIMTTSLMPEAAREYVRFLGSKENQKRYSRRALPAYRSLYDDAGLFATRPDLIQAAKAQYAHVQNRPAVFYYPKMTMALQNELGEALRGRKKAEAALSAAAAKTKAAAQERLVYTR